MQMIRWMCGISMKDRRTNEELRRMDGVQPIITVIRSGRLRWYGHVMRKGDRDWVRKCMEFRVEGRLPIASSTSINKLQVMQNAALRTATGCTQDTNIQHLHDETLTLPIHEHLQLHASQYKQRTQHPSHPLHKHTTYFNTPRLKKTLFLTTAATQQTFPQTPTQSLQQT